MTHQVKLCVDLKSLPFLVNLNAGFFLVATEVKHGFGTFTVASHMATASLNSIHPLNSFSRCLKSSPVLGLSLPGPLLSPMVTKVVGYALANS